MVEKLVAGPFLKKQNWPYLWINGLKFYTVCVYCMACWRLSKYIKTKLPTTYFHLILSFLKKKLVSLPHFLHNFWSKIFLLLYIYILLTDQIKLLSGCLYFVRFWQYVYCNCLKTVTSWILKFNLSFSDQAIFPTWPKSCTKTLNILRMERQRAFNMK